MLISNYWSVLAAVCLMPIVVLAEHGLELGTFFT